MNVGGPCHSPPFGCDALHGDGQRLSSLKPQNDLGVLSLVSETTSVEVPSVVDGLLRDLRAHLAWQRDASGAELMGMHVRPQAPSAAPVAVPGTSADAGVLPPLAKGVGRRTLDEIRRELGDCRRCKLCSGRKQIVFGSGNPKARLVFVGEGPGAEEDAQGLPFVGAAGQLLTKMVLAMGLTRDAVYICNVVKCRPPGNRNPEPDEIAACEPFLRAQLESIGPEVVVALGKFAAQTLLRDATPITRLRGQWRTYQGMKLMPTFHPAYLLRNPAEKKPCWEDLKAVMAVLAKAAPEP
jgi:uracil-DNA glycosylase